MNTSSSTPAERAERPTPGGRGADTEVGSCNVLERGPDLTVLSVSGEADLALAPQLRSLLDDSSESDLVLVVMSECTFMDSSVIATLLEAARELRVGPGQGLALIAPGEGPARMLELTGTADSLPVFPSRDAALQAIRGPEPGL